MRIPIRFQFMLPLLAVATASLLTVGLVYSRLATRQTTARIEKQLQGVVSVLADSSYPLTDAVLRQMGDLAQAEFVLTDGRGRRLASGCAVDCTGLAADALPAGTVGQVSLGPPIVLDSRQYLHSTVRIERRSNLYEPGVLHILFAQDTFDAAWRSAFLPPVIVGAVTIVALAVVIHLVAGRVSKVLFHLGQEVERLAEGDFSEVRQPYWNDETRDLASAVNHTARRLADYETKLRQTERMRTVAMLGAGLAHEMRNAATGCRLAVDLHAEACHGDATDESLDVARRQLITMENRLQQLLQLGHQPAAARKQAVDFAALVSDSIAMIKPAARHASVELSWYKPSPPVIVNADAELLGQAVMNLLINALHAAAKNQVAGNLAGSVNIQLFCAEGMSELVVADSGSGPAEPLAESVFEPFVTSKSEGVGLGLAVAKRVIESLDGQIDWQRETGLTKFRIRLPLAATGVRHG